MKKMHLDFGQDTWERRMPGVDMYYSESEVLYKAKKAGQKELGGFSIEDAIMEAFKLGAETAAEAIEEELDY